MKMRDSKVYRQLMSVFCKRGAKSKKSLSIRPVIYLNAGCVASALLKTFSEVDFKDPSRRNSWYGRIKKDIWVELYGFPSDINFNDLKKELVSFGVVELGSVNTDIEEIVKSTHFTPSSFLKHYLERFQEELKPPFALKSDTNALEEKMDNMQKVFNSRFRRLAKKIILITDPPITEEKIQKLLKLNEEEETNHE